MVRRSYSPEQIINKLREVEALISQGATTVEASRKVGITEQTYYRWRREYDGMRIDLAQDSISLEVVDLRSIYPIDKTMVLDSVSKTGRLVIAHQAWRTGGVGAEISAVVAEEALSSLKAPIARVAALDVPVPFNRALQVVMLPSR